MAEIQGGESFERRAQLASHLKGFVDRIMLFPGGPNMKVRNPEVEELMLATYGKRRVEHVAALPDMSADRRYFVVVFKDKTYRLVQPDLKDPACLLDMRASGEEYVAEWNVQS